MCIYFVQNTAQPAQTEEIIDAHCAVVHLLFEINIITKK